MRTRTLLLLIFSLSLFAACRSDAPRDSNGASSATTLDPESPSFSIYQLLRASGNNVEIVGDTLRPFFTPKAKVLAMNGSAVQLYEYGSKEDLQAEAAKVSPDGATIGGTMMHWKVPPHFYKTERVIMLYEGNDPKTKGNLDAALGAQFAGGN